MKFVDSKPLDFFLQKIEVSKFQIEFQKSNKKVH